MRRVPSQEPAGSYQVEFKLKKDSLPEEHAILGGGITKRKGSSVVEARQYLFMQLFCIF